MPNFTADQVFDAALQHLEDNAELFVLLNGQPASYAEANAVHAGVATDRRLASVAIDAADFTQANGDASGRKSTLAAQTVNGEHTAGGEVIATYWAILDVTGTTLLAYGPLQSSVGITNGVTQDVNAFDVLEITDTVAA